MKGEGQKCRSEKREEFTCSAELPGGSSTKVPSYQINKRGRKGGG